MPAMNMLELRPPPEPEVRLPSDVPVMPSFVPTVSVQVLKFTGSPSVAPDVACASPLHAEVVKVLPGRRLSHQVKMSPMPTMKFFWQEKLIGSSQLVITGKLSLFDAVTPAVKLCGLLVGPRARR